jgi:methylated-DNA-protein-cysteine methyltransferase-like protein
MRAKPMPMTVYGHRVCLVRAGTIFPAPKLTAKAAKDDRSHARYVRSSASSVLLVPSPARSLVEGETLGGCDAFISRLPALRPIWGTPGTPRAHLCTDDGARHALFVSPSVWSKVMDENIERRVREIIEAIPPGQVLSYGEVAAVAGIRSARLVGQILSRSDGLPWHRVLRADGTPTPHLAERQLALLRAEGARVVNGRVVR